MHSAASPEDLHKLFKQMLNSGDIDALVDLYAVDGFLMARGAPARGSSTIRQELAKYVAMKPTIQRATRRVVQAGDTALTSGTSIEVARRQPDGSWRYVIDLPFGLE